MDEKVKKKRKRKKKKKKQGMSGGVIALLVVAVIAILGAALVGILYHSGKSRLFNTVQAAPKTDTWENQEQQRKEIGTAVDWQDNWIAVDGEVYEYNKEIINLLFIGIDAKGAIAGKTDYEKYSTGQADAIFVLSLNPATKTMKILGIPRNSMVPLRIFNEQNEVVDEFTNQICLQYPYAGGGQNGLTEMSRAVSELLYQVPIQGCFAIGYDSIGMINDTLGGVTVEVLETVPTDKKLVQGETVHLMGKTAIAYVTNRDCAVLGSPTNRLRRQKQYLVELVNVGKSKLKENPMIVRYLFDAMTDYMNTNVTLDEIVYIATQGAGYSFDTDSFYMLEGVDQAESYINSKGQADFYDDLYLFDGSIQKNVIDVFYTPVVLQP